MFVNVHGSVVKTDLKIMEDQETKVDLDSWKNFPVGPFETYIHHSNVVSFQVDKKLLV